MNYTEITKSAASATNAPTPSRAGLRKLLSRRAVRLTAGALTLLAVGLGCAYVNSAPMGGLPGARLLVHHVGMPSAAGMPAPHAHFNPSVHAHAHALPPAAYAHLAAMLPPQSAPVAARNFAPRSMPDAPMTNVHARSFDVHHGAMHPFAHPLKVHQGAPDFFAHPLKIDHGASDNLVHSFKAAGM